nr:MAG TPA: hypothetical protein [Caudoviricetes sp.]
MALFNITVARRNTCSRQDDIIIYLNILIYKKY